MSISYNRSYRIQLYRDPTGRNVTTYATTTIGQMGGDGRSREAYKSGTQIKHKEAAQEARVPDFAAQS